MQQQRPGLTPCGTYWLSKRSGSDAWQRTWFDPGSRQTRRESLRTADFQAAHAELITWWAANRELSNERPETVTLAEVLIRYYRDHASHLASETQARIACQKLSSACGDLSVQEFGPQAQKAFAEGMRAAGASAGYIRRTLSVGKAALGWAWAAGLVRMVPTVKLPPDGAGRERILTLAEMTALFDAATEDHVYRFLVLACATWSRPDALLDLDRSRCDLGRRLIALNPEGRLQTKKFRPTVPLVDSALHVITDIPRGTIITWRGKQLADIKTAWRRLRKRADLDEGVIPYLVRHTMATEARSAGAPPWEVEGWLGHKRPTTSERYAKFSPDFLGSTARIVDDYIKQLPLRA